MKPVLPHGGAELAGGTLWAKIRGFAPMARVKAASCAVGVWARFVLSIRLCRASLAGACRSVDICRFVHAGRGTKGADCGEPTMTRYRRYMATINITESEFTTTLEENDIVFVDFWAAWCGPCRQFAPIYDDISEKYPEVKFAKVDTEAEQGLARAANITSIPTLMAFRDQVLVFSQPGAMNASQLDDLVVAVKGIDMEQVHAQIAEQESQAQ